MFIITTTTFNYNRCYHLGYIKKIISRPPNAFLEPQLSSKGRGNRRGLEASGLGDSCSWYVGLILNSRARGGGKGKAAKGALWSGLRGQSRELQPEPKKRKS